MNRFIAALFFCLLAISSCSTPTGLDSTTKWEVCYSLPLTNVTISVNDVFNQLILDSAISVNDESDSTLGDTMTFTFESRDQEEYRFKLFDQSLLEKEIRCDTIKIENMPQIASDLLLKKFIDEYDKTITAIQTFPSSFFEYIKFDSFSEKAQISLTNNTKASIFNDCEITLLNGDSTISVTAETVFTPGKTINLSLPVSMKELRDSITIMFHSTVDGILPDTTDLISLNLDLNGTSIEEAVINSKFLDFDFSFDTYIPIPNDSFLIHYADIDELSVPVSLFNPFPFSLNITATLSNVYDRDFARSKNWDNLDDINELVPEQFQKGKQTLSINKNENHFQLSCDKSRLFPQMNKDGVSSIPVRISGSISTTDELVHISNWKDIRVTTSDCSVRVAEIRGHYQQEPYFPGTTKSFEIPLTGINSVTSQLRDKVRLTNSTLAMTLDFKFNDYSSIEKMKYWCILEMYCNEEVRTDTFSWEMEEIVSDEKVTVTFDCNKLINSFPDSITYRVAYSFPKESTLNFADSLFKNEDGLTSLVIPVEYDLNLKSDFIWEITDSILLDLGTSDIPLTVPDSWKKPLEDKKLELSFNLLNNSNFSGTILSVAVPNGKKEFLDTLEKEELYSLFIHDSFPRNLIPILGDNGITVPHRGESHENTVVIPDHSILDILAAETLHLKQVLLIPPTKADALLDSDFLSLDATFALKGIQSSDMFNAE